jgi:hypothetical protein
MNANFAEWSVILLCLSMASALGGGLYEHITGCEFCNCS